GRLRRAAGSGLPRIVLLPGRALSSLALGTPVGDAVVVALAAAHDRRPAARALAAGAAVDTPLSMFSGERLPPQARRLGEHGLELRVVRLCQSPPRREPDVPERLGAPDVPDACDEALVEKRLSELAVLIDGPEAREHRRQVRRFGENVGPQAACGMV